MTGPDAVEDLLEAHHDTFAAALDEFEDRLEYTVHGRFDEEEMIAHFLTENPDAGELADQVRGQPEVESRKSGSGSAR